MSEDGAKPQPLSLSRKSQKRWAIGGCFGCFGFASLAFILAVLGVKTSLEPGRVWTELSAYMDFETPPKGFKSLFVVPFFDQRQIAFYREADKTHVMLQEYSGRVREDFDDAFDVEILKAGGATEIESGSFKLQGREVAFVRFLGGAAGNQEMPKAGEVRSGMQGMILDAFNMLPEDPPTFPVGTPLIRMRFSGVNDNGGTLIMVRAPTLAVMTVADLSDLFAPFDLWSQVDSAPKAPEPLESKEN